MNEKKIGEEMYQKLAIQEWKGNTFSKMNKKQDNWFKIIQHLIFKALKEKCAPGNQVCGQLKMLCYIKKSEARKRAELIEDIRKRSKLIKLMKKKLDSKISSLKSFKGEFNQYKEKMDNMGKIEEGKTDLDSYKHKIRVTIETISNNFKTLSDNLNKTKDEIKESIKLI